MVRPPRIVAEMIDCDAFNRSCDIHVSRSLGFAELAYGERLGTVESGVFIEISALGVAIWLLATIIVSWDTQSDDSCDPSHPQGFRNVVDHARSPLAKRMP